MRWCPSPTITATAHCVHAWAADKMNMARRWVLTPGEYGSDKVGSKATTLQALAAALPASIATPASACVPFSALHRMIEASENAELADVAEADSKQTPHPAVQRAEQVLRLPCFAWVAQCLLSTLLPCLPACQKDHSTGVESLAAVTSASNAGMHNDALVLACALLDWWRSCVQVHVPEELQAALSEAVGQIIAQSGSAQDEQPSVAAADVLAAVKRVWASKWNDRALRACKQLQVPLDAVHMSVLLQPLLRASVAFVSHTRDPRHSAAPQQDSSAGATAAPKMYIEAVTGLGESLVGNVAGQPLAATVDTAQLCAAARAAAGHGDSADSCAAALQCLHGADAADSNDALQLHEWVGTWSEESLHNAMESIAIESAASKAWAVVPADAVTSSASDAERPSASAYGLIARSASNMEDLADYAGAGVFDSFPTAATAFAPARPGALGGDWQAVAKQLVVIALASAEVAARLGGEQDVEGLLGTDGAVCIVQARPQV